MATRNQLKIIDKLNRAFETAGNKFVQREYSSNINAIQKASIDMFEKTGKLNTKDIRKIINDNPIGLEGFNKNAFMAYILSAITLIITNIKTMTKKQRVDLAPIFILLGLKTTAKRIKIKDIRPNAIVNNVFRLTNPVIKGQIPVNLKPSQTKAFEQLDKYFKKKSKQIKQSARVHMDNMKRLNRKMTKNLSTDIMSDLKRFNKQRLNGKPLTFEQVAAKLKKKYGDAAVRVERILRTEVHAQNEVTKLLSAKISGFSHKTWNNNPTGGKGGPVRGVSKKDKFNHKMLNGKTIKINDKFVLIGGTADAPGDPSLPPGDRVNCRCFLTFDNK